MKFICFFIYNKNMKRIIFIALVCAFLFGCVQAPQTGYDEFLGIYEVDDTFAPAVQSKAMDGNLMLELRSSLYKEVDILEKNTTIKVKRCTQGKEEALISAIMGNKRSCSDLTCNIIGVVHEERNLYVNATCSTPIAEKGKAYIVYLGLKALVPDGSMAITVFPVCSTGEEFDTCEAEYEMVFQKR